MYICRPDDKEGPQKTLRGFQRVSIAKGKTQNVQIELPYDSFEWFDAATNTIRPLNGTYKILTETVQMKKTCKRAVFRFNRQCYYIQFEAGLMNLGYIENL